MADSRTSGGLGLCSTLVVIFVVLKATDNITWSWWWVFSPWWIMIAVVGAVGLLVVIAQLVRLPFELRARRRKFDRDLAAALRASTSKK